MKPTIRLVIKTSKCVIGSAPATFMMSRTPTSPEDLLVHKQDEYVAAADFRPWAHQRTQSLFHVCFSRYLQEESIRGELSVTRPWAADTTRGSEIAIDNRRGRLRCDQLGRLE